MNNQIISLQTGRISQLTAPSQRNILKDGSSVYVKVLADKGGGNYVGSVAGNRVNISSSRGLQVGSSFVATISSKNGVIYISPKGNLSGAFTVNSGVQTSVLQSEQLASVLSQLGVPVNSLSGNLLKMMVQLEIKVDGGVLRGLYKQAVKHKGKEKAAGELIALLQDKGIDVSEEELEELLDYLQFQPGSDRNNLEQENFYHKKSKELINKNNKIENGWTIVPYNLVEINSSDSGSGAVSGNSTGTNNGEDNVIGAGVIRMLFDKSSNLKILNLNCYYGNREYIFSLSFENKQCKKIKFNISPQEKSEESYVKLFKKYVTKNDEKLQVQVEWADASLIEGCASEDVEIISFQGEA